MFDDNYTPPPPASAPHLSPRERAPRAEVHAATAPYFAWSSDRTGAGPFATLEIALRTMRESGKTSEIVDATGITMGYTGKLRGEQASTLAKKVDKADRQNAEMRARKGRAA